MMEQYCMQCGKRRLRSSGSKWWHLAAITLAAITWAGSNNIMLD